MSTSRHSRGGRQYVKSHIRSVSPGGPGSRDVEADIEQEARRWASVATKLGWCNGCGATIDEANGKLHDEGCIPSAPERCRKGQRT